MSREIKFRAWAEDWNTNKMTMFYDVQCAYDTISNDGDVKPHDQWTNFSNVLDEDETVVMQYTGLKDKNGKEIYEGDILKIFNHHSKSETIGEVIFDEGCFVWKGGNVGACLIGSWEANHSRSSRDEHEVIGNIYENPELLEKKRFSKEYVSEKKCTCGYDNGSDGGALTQHLSSCWKVK